MKKLILGFSLLFSLNAVADNIATSNNVTESSSIPTISTARYVTGGVLGSVFGFGIGHMVEGRFLNKGWIFTASEVASFTLLLAGNCTIDGHNSRGPNGDQDDGDKLECDNNTQALTGALMMLGFRAWEIVDLWIGAKPGQTSVMILPSEDGAKLSWAMSF